MSIAELEHELRVHQDIYEIARDKLLESEQKLTEAIIEEERLRRNSEYTRKSLILAFVGVGMAVVMAKIWG